MKKSLPRKYYFFLILIFSYTAFNLPATAQDIPNPGFEDWSGGEPVDWNTINQNILGTTFTPVTREVTNPHTGISAVKLETITENIFLVGPVTMPGILSLGEIILDVLNQTGTVEGGVPVSGAPVVLRGWFRYLPQAGDSCMMGIGLTRWNGMARDTLAYAYLTIGGQNPDWQEFALPIEYLAAEEPDTMNIMFFSSNLLTGSPVSGSTLWVDDLWLEYGTVSVNDAGRNDAFRMFVINQGEQLEIRREAGKSGTLQIISMNGTLMVQRQLQPDETAVRFELRNYPPAMYIARFLSAGGEQHVVKFIRH